MNLSDVIYCVYRYIESNKTKFINNLKEAVSIQSVSGEIKNRQDVVNMMKWAESKLKSLGVSVELCDIGFQVLCVYFIV